MKRNILLLTGLLICLSQILFAQNDVPSSEQRGYLLGPGDQVTARVLGEPQFDFVAVVNEEGKIEVPFLDQPIVAMCKNEREMRAEVSKILSKYLRAPQVSLAITERKSRPPVTVSGEVGKQQQVDLTRKTRLWELITFSGGITEEAGGMIQVFRTQAPICSSPEEAVAWKAENEMGKDFGGGNSRLYSISTVQQGRDESNPIIYPGDIIIVQKAKPVYIVGEVRGGQGGLMLKEGGLPLTRAIAMVGGVSREAKTKDIKIYRQKPDSMEKQIISANLDLIKKNQQKDIMLEPYDIIEVDKAKTSILSTIIKTVTGAATGGLGSIVTGGMSRAVLY